MLLSALFNTSVTRSLVARSLVSRLQRTYSIGFFVKCSAVGFMMAFWFGFAPMICKAQENSEIDFGLQIRPILAEHCFHCHGPDPAHREADLRLDEEESAKTLRDGKRAIAASDPNASEILHRIASDDPDLVMPPPSARKTVTPAQRELLLKWIEQGARWGNQWSLNKPKIAPLPESAKDPWGKHPIDAWILQAMRDRGLEPAPPAPPEVLARRLSLDLVGLPPESHRVARFVEEIQQGRSVAIARYVDELLQSPSFGEHWARIWLDLARYADTKGYEKDLKRDLWPYRDWVIQALNDDMPYDRFTIEQLAGDLLDQPTNSQKIATAFHRATLSNDEGGTDDEEFRIAAVKDRVDTTLQVWMGLTAGCAKCHSHKYDPISMEDYYSFYAIWNQTEDADRYDDEPRMPVPSFEQQSQLASLQSERQRLTSQLDRAQLENQALVEQRWTLAKPTAVDSESHAALFIEEDSSVRAAADRPATDTYILEVTLPPGTYHALRIEALMAKATPEDPSPRLGLNSKDPNFVINSLEVLHGPTQARVGLKAKKVSFEQNGWPLTGAVDDDSKTGWAISPKQQQSHWGILELAQPLVVSEKVGDAEEKLVVRIVQSYGGHLMLHRVRIAFATDATVPLIVEELPAVEAIAKRSQELDKQIQSLRESIPKLPVMRELASASKRQTRLHRRGSFLDPGDALSPALPRLFDAEEAGVPDRLAAARWLVDPRNPLTPRVAVNRVWGQIFGRGIVETEEDFGSQGMLPTHPELLDWLAIEYRDTKHWSLKELLKTIVSTNTYQQAYVQDEQRKERDPRNLWMSYSPRFRLSAEVVRDQALEVAGLLSRKRGGAPVMPPQPEGLWRSTYSGAQWITSPGEDRFRRGIYTFWKRTTPYPSMEVFDATTREVCQIRRIATNTPLQALVTLNDPVYVEAAVGMAKRWMSSSDSQSDRIRTGFAQALCRPIEPDELERLMLLLSRAKEHFEASPDSAKALLSDIPFASEGEVRPSELAAWSMVTSAILNLDEMLMRP